MRYNVQSHRLLCGTLRTSALLRAGFAILQNTSESGLCHAGVKFDEMNIRMILQACSELDELHAIAVVVNGTIARDLTSLRNTFNRLANSLPTAVLENTVAIITNCDRTTM